MKCILSSLHADATGQKLSQIHICQANLTLTVPPKGPLQRVYLENFEEHMKWEKVGGKHLLKVEVDPLGLQQILVSTFTAAPQEAASPKVEKN